MIITVQPIEQLVPILPPQQVKNLNDILQPLFVDEEVVMVICHLKNLHQCMCIMDWDPGQDSEGMVSNEEDRV